MAAKWFGLVAVAASFLGYLGVMKNKSLANAGGNFVVDSGNVNLETIYRKHALINGLDWRLLKAIAITESNENPGALGDDGKSQGIMQVHCDANCPTCYCKNKLNVVGWGTATPEKLMDPDFNVKIAAQILAWNIGMYGHDKGIAVYNNWSSRLDPQEGPFRNQQYVDKVTGTLSYLATNS